MSKNKEDQERKNKKLSDSQSASDSQEEEQNRQQEAYESDFVNDDESQQDYGYYRPIDMDDEDYGKKEKKKKKNKSKQKKEGGKKSNRHYDDDDESYNQDDLDVIQDYQKENKKLKRLKKKKVEQQSQQSAQKIEKDIEEQQFEDGGYNYGSEYDQIDKQVVQDQIVIDKNIHDIFEPSDLLGFYTENQDKQIMDLDLPERQIMEILNVAKATGKPIQLVKKDFENQDRSSQARWIYQKLRNINYFQHNEERACKQTIFNVLMMMHRQHLEIMHIYYYKKKRYGNILTLDLLWKIHQYDEQWISFQDQSQKISSTFQNVLNGIKESSKSLTQMMENCNDLRVLKYFKQYESFLFAKMGNSGDLNRRENKSKINDLIKQITVRGVAKWLQESEIFLSPENLALNLRQRQKIKKPRTPYLLPKEQIENHFKSDQQTEINFPLLHPDIRIQSICKYLEYELFSYPELRKILKDKYYKKLILTTTPTKQGEQDINLYSNYFPVKRIKEKPVSTLKREIWILALQAEKLDLIKIDLKFEWELSSSEPKNFDSDTIYLDLGKNYFDVNVNNSGDNWNLFRRCVLQRMLQSLFFPSFIKEVKQDLTKQGQNDIINACCLKLRSQLMKGPYLRNQRSVRILSLVLANQQLGIAYVDQFGQAHETTTITLHNDDDIKRFVKDELLYNFVDNNKPELIVIAANCRKAQTLRKQLRQPFLFKQTIFCCYGQNQVSSLMANKLLIKKVSQPKVVLQAISMARMKQNPLAQILSLWDSKIQQNAVLSMNLHPLQKAVPQMKLKDALQKVAIQAVNLVGIDINLIKQYAHFQNQLQFVSGLGPRKAFSFLERIKQESQIQRRTDIYQFVSGPIVYKNCSSFFKIQTSLHKNLLQRDGKDKKKNKSTQQINLFDMTRIPDQWFKLAQKMLIQAVGQVNIFGLTQKKQYAGLKQQVICLIQCFKHPQKLKNAQCDKKAEDYFTLYFDQELIRSQIANRFKNPRQPERPMENKQTFYYLLKQTPQTLKRYMIFTVKILSVNQQYLNVVISQNGLFGYIRLPFENNKKYQKGDHIKALILGFPFDEKKKNNGQVEQELLKVQMALKFPHKSQDSNHDCFAVCFPPIVKEIHPLIDLDKQRFDLKKDDRPVIEVTEENVPRVRTEYRRISHPKYKNMNSGSAINYIKGEPIGQFVIRPSSEGPDFLVITWHFYKNVVAHIKIKSQAKSSTNPNLVYRIIDRERDKIFSTLDEILDKYIKPMNNLVQDAISHKKFLATSLDQIEERAKSDMQRDPNHIHYFFGCHQDYAQYIILVYIYRDKKPVKELIKVRHSGLYFHENQFLNIRDLIVWFKQHFKDKQYQKYAKSTAIKK